MSIKKLLALALVASVVCPVFAEDGETDQGGAKKQERAEESTAWPAFFAICQFPACPDVAGLRLTVPFSTRQDNVTGIDLGLWGRAQYFEGIQVNVLRNDVKDTMSGFQFGLYNSIGHGEMLGLQAGLWNESGCVRGFQIGLVNVAGEAQGLQVGLINRAETMYGFQVGLINVIRDAELQFFPIINIGW